jgi:hypothetical protein
MMLPTVKALQKLGGSGNTDEMFARVAEIMNLTDAVLAIPHGATSDSEVEYRLAWSRTYWSAPPVASGLFHQTQVTSKSLIPRK